MSVNRSLIAPTTNPTLEQALREGIACGEVRADIDPAAMATALWGMFNGVLTLGVRNDGFRLKDAAWEKVLASATSVILEGLADRQTQP